MSESKHTTQQHDIITQASDYRTTSTSLQKNYCCTTTALLLHYCCTTAALLLKTQTSPALSSVLVRGLFCVLSSHEIFSESRAVGSHRLGAEGVLYL